MRFILALFVVVAGSVSAFGAANETVLGPVVMTDRSYQPELSKLEGALRASGRSFKAYVSEFAVDGTEKAFDSAITEDECCASAKVGNYEVQYYADTNGYGVRINEKNYGEVTAEAARDVLARSFQSLDLANKTFRIRLTRVQK